jgi:hypothetical protein
VMDPLVDIKEMKTEQIWGKGLTTPTEEAMLKIAAGLQAEEAALLNQGKRTSTAGGRNGESEGGRAAKDGDPWTAAQQAGSTRIYRLPIRTRLPPGIEDGPAPTAGRDAAMQVGSEGDFRTMVTSAVAAMTDGRAGAGTVGEAGGWAITTTR